MEKVSRIALVFTLVGGVCLMGATLSPGWMIMTIESKEDFLSFAERTTVKMSIWYMIACQSSASRSSSCAIVSLSKILKLPNGEIFIQYMIFSVISVAACFVALYKVSNVSRKKVRTSFISLLISIIFTSVLCGKMLHENVKASKISEIFQGSEEFENISITFDTPYSVILGFIGGYFTLIAALITAYILCAGSCATEHTDTEFTERTDIELTERMVSN